MLHDLLPVTDRLVKALIAMPSLETQEAVRRVVLARQAELEERAGQFRILLYATSLLLLGFLVHLGLQLRARARALRQRAALEHVIAGISTRFISLRPREIDAHIEQALAQLARCIGADRAYLILPGAPSRVLWLVPGGGRLPRGLAGPRAGLGRAFPGHRGGDRPCPSRGAPAFRRRQIRARRRRPQGLGLRAERAGVPRRSWASMRCVRP